MNASRRTAAFLVVFAAALLALQGAAHALVVNPIIAGRNGAQGSDHSVRLNRSFFVERYAGALWRINMGDLSTAVIGINYTEPVDLALAADNLRAYVIENGNGGTLVRVDLASADRTAATTRVIAQNIGGAGGQILTQIALDEAHSYAYVVQNSGVGTIWRINLANGQKTAVLTNIVGRFGTAPGGLVLTQDASVAYFTTLGLAGKLIRLNLGTGVAAEILGGLTNPIYLDWAGSGDSALLLADAGRISRVTVTTAPAVLQPIVTGLNYNTRSVRRVADDRLLVAVSDTVYDVLLSPFVAAGPIILGIGHVPFDRISPAGYADTTVDPGYFFQVKDSPFGGTLSLMVNHDGAYALPMGARYYKVLVDGVTQLQSWSDYLLNPATGQFVLKTIVPDAAGFYAVRRPIDIWYNHWLGCRLDTTGLTNGLHVITVRMYKPDRVTLAGSATVNVRIDNRWPTATINKIFHDGVEILACAIVNGGTDAFTFRVTALDPDGHLASWGLYALWGDNQSALVDSDSYNNHPPGPFWFGINNAVVPLSLQPWHAIEECCAHTFHLSVWDRVIDGYSYLHWSGYNKSITIMLGPNCNQCAQQ